jgi:hypothetical protein
MNIAWQMITVFNSATGSITCLGFCIENRESRICHLAYITAYIDAP